MKRSIAVAAAIAAAASAPALAQQGTQGWYGALTLGQGGINISAAEIGLSTGKLDDNDTTFGARIGYDFNPWIGVEAAYNHLGSYKFDGFLGPLPASGEVRVRSYNAMVVGTFPIGETFGIYGKVGIARTKADASADVIGFSGREEDSETETVYGAGVKWMFDKKWGVFGEWNHLKDTRVANWMIGSMLRF